MASEFLENKRKKLIFRSGHRGTKEMDLIMGSFAQANVPDFSESEVEEYDLILQLSDPDLYNWLTGKEEAPANVAAMSVFQKLLAHKLA